MESCMKDDRLKSKWEHPRRHAPSLSGNNQEFLEFHKRFTEKHKSKREDLTEGDLYTSMLKDCEEIILNKDEKGYYLCAILRSIDTDTFEIVTQYVFGIYDFKDIEEIKLHLAVAMIHDVPIYGNTPELHRQLECIQEDIIKNGILFDRDGKRELYTIDKYRSLNFDDGISALRELMISSPVFPGALKIVDERISNRIVEYEKAAQFVDTIERAAIELKEFLNLQTRNEGLLQKHLVNNPILFGTEYKAIYPKHKLGAEYEMDYALERFDGVYDLVEIESSNLPLYNKNYNPSQFLVHAEQQILDWQEWLEEKNFYAREKSKIYGALKD
jgi:hypothetical protein